MPDIMLDIRLIVFLAIVGVLAYLGWEWHEKDVKLQAQAVLIARQQAAAEAAQTTIINTGKSDAVTQAVNNQSQIDQQKSQQSQTNIQQKTSQKVAQINTIYSAKPSTPATIQQRTNDIAATELDGVWNSYCATGTTDANCPTTPDAQAPPATAAPTDAPAPSPSIIIQQPDPTPAPAAPSATPEPQIHLPTIPLIGPAEKILGI